MMKLKIKSLALACLSFIVHPTFTIYTEGPIFDSPKQMIEFL
jgi:hypothetical protein